MRINPRKKVFSPIREEETSQLSTTERYFTAKSQNKALSHKEITVSGGQRADQDTRVGILGRCLPLHSPEVMYIL